MEIRTHGFSRRCSTAWVFAITLSYLAAPPKAQADPFLVTAGTIAMPSPGARFQDGSLTLEGPDIAVGVVAGWFPGSRLPGIFRPGSTVDLSTTVTPGGWGFARVTTDRYDLVNFSGELSFTAVPFVFNDSGEDFSSVSTPFTMTGELVGHFRENPSQLAFRIGVMGAGTMGGSPLRRFNEVDAPGRVFYSSFQASTIIAFHEQPTPVPEPGSLVLCGLGLAGLARKWHRRRTVG